MKKRINIKNDVEEKVIKIVIVGEDGRVTLPTEIRRTLEIEVGDRVLWILEGNSRAYVKKVSAKLKG